MSLYIKKACQDLELVMIDRHRKYGPDNIAKHGLNGILVRMDDKFARLEAGLENHQDESVIDTLMDIAGYAIIAKLWVEERWPGSAE